MRNDMIQGSASRKAQAPTKRRAASSPRKGFPAIALAIALAAALAVGGTIAWLTDSTDEVVNVFEPSGVPITVVEDFDGETKSEVRIQNQGDIDAYIRAYVAINWTDSAGNVVTDVPSGYSYDITGSIGSSENGWVPGADGYYYYLTPVDPDDGNPETTADMTGILIDSIKQTRAGDDYFLQVDIVAQSIQADGVNADEDPAVVEAWGPTVTGIDADGKLTIAKKTA